MTNDERQEAAMLALRQARKDLRNAWDRVQYARDMLDGLPVGSVEYIRNQCGFGALWALSNQWSQASSTLKTIIKGLEARK